MKIKNFPKYFIFFITVINFLIACNSEKNKEEEHEVEKAKADTITKLTYEKLPLVKDFSGKVYSFIANHDSTACDEIFGGDCNGLDILFLNEKEFIYTSFCVTTLFFSTGKYSLEASNVFLKFDTLEIELQKIFRKGSVTDSIIFKTSNSNIKILPQFQCKDKMYLKWRETDYTYYGFHDLKKSLESEIQELKKDSVWYKLEKK